MGIKSIADAFDISRNTVRKYVRLYQQSGLSMENLLSMPSHKVQELLGPSAERAVIPSERRQQLEALLPEYAERLKQRGVMVKTLFEEYSSTHPDGYRHAQFEALLYRYRLKTKAVGHVEHYAGDQMYVDFAGDRLAIVEPETGEKRKVEVFVAILPCSHYTYCEAVWSQKKEDLIKASENALHFYGGVPLAIVPDNLKSAVTSSDRHEPVIQEDFAAFAEHYGMAVYPARVRKPKDKALVENAVKLLYRSVYVDIKDREFHSLEELNEAIRASLERFNERKLSGRNQSRRQLFESVERDFLRPLPAMRHQMRQRKSVTVMRNSYVTLNKHHYSVPTKYIGKRVELVYDADTVEIFHSLTLVTSHHRDDTPYTYTQKEAHNLPGHHGAYEKDLDELYSRAAQIDNILLLFLKNVATAAKYSRSFSAATMPTTCPRLRTTPTRLALSSRHTGTSAGRPTSHKTTTTKKTTMETNKNTSPVIEEKDRNAISLDLMNRMKLHGMASAFRESLNSTMAENMTIDAFLSMLLSQEWDYRSNAAIERLIRAAGFRYKAYPEQIDYTIPRGLDRNQMERLASLEFVRQARNLFITGSSGTGKSFLASALGHEACKKGIRTYYANASKLMGMLKVAKTKGTLETEMKRIERCSLLILDDLFLVPLDAKERPLLLDIIEDRHERKSIIITSQLPLESWYDAIGDQTVADAILDRIVHSAHRIELTGESVRKMKTQTKK